MKRKFNIIDGIILVIILAVIAALVFFYFNLKNGKISKDGEQDTAKISFKLELNNLNLETAEFMRVAEGKSVQFGLTSSGSGVIEKIEVEPYQKITTDYEKGEYVLTEIPDKYRVTITVVSDVVKTPDSYKSGDEIIAIGKLMPFNSAGIASEDSYIVDLYGGELR